jgi:hypothetical protein
MPKKFTPYSPLSVPAMIRQDIWERICSGDSGVAAMIEMKDKTTTDSIRRADLIGNMPKVYKKSFLRGRGYNLPAAI